MEFEFSPHSASQDHINPQPSSKSESNDIGTGFAMFSQNFGEFSSRSGPNQNLYTLGLKSIATTSLMLICFNVFQTNLKKGKEEHFINYLTPDIRIVRELPKELQSLDLEAISSVVNSKLKLMAGSAEGYSGKISSRSITEEEKDKALQAEILEKINMEAKMAELSNLVRENSTKKDHTQTNNQVPPGEYRLSAIAATLENGVGLRFAPSYIDVVVKSPVLNIEFSQVIHHPK
ncbi:hypothetical protein JHK87_027848 [Glycine soja]|nr:hypothetical protein JHK87_027848 [Glycine soja]